MKASKIVFISILIGISSFAFVNHVSAATLAEQLSGQILLQVQQHGEAWYVNPVDLNRYYMKDGATAYEMMRSFGLGITNTDLSKIPIGIESRVQDPDTDNDGLSDKLEGALGSDSKNPDSDGDGYSDGTEVTNGYSPLIPYGTKVMIDSALVNRLKGRILLQVQSRGEAWYIYPKDGKRYYMKDGDSAYQIMRYLSLGITDADLAKIPSEPAVRIFAESQPYAFQLTLPDDWKDLIVKEVAPVGNLDKYIVGYSYSLVAPNTKKVTFMFGINVYQSSVWQQVKNDVPNSYVLYSDSEYTYIHGSRLDWDSSEGFPDTLSSYQIIIKTFKKL